MIVFFIMISNTMIILAIFIATNIRVRISIVIVAAFCIVITFDTYWTSIFDV